MRPKTGQTPLQQQQSQQQQHQHHSASLQQQQQHFLESTNHHKNVPPPGAASSAVYVHPGLALTPSSQQQQNSNHPTHHHQQQHPGASYSQHPHPHPAHHAHHYPVPPHHHAGTMAPPQPPQHMWNHPNCYPGQNPGNPHMNVQNNRGQFTIGGSQPPPPSSRHYGPPPNPGQHPGHPHQQQHPNSHMLHHGHYAPQTPSSTIPGPHGGGERMPLTPPNYAKLPPLSAVNQQRINECAGIPLISTATAHLTPGQRQRISRKQSHSPPGKNWTHILAANNNAGYAAAAQFAAAHVQGAPLMINNNNKSQQPQQKPLSAEYWSTQNYKQRGQAGQPSNSSTTSSAASGSSFSNPKTDKLRTPLRYQSSAPASLSSSRSKENLEAAAQQKESENSNSSSNSNTGDSSNGGSNDTCLPRIIKPRKRRKKDRKPNNNLVNAVYLKLDTKLTQSGGGGNLSSEKSLTSSSLKSFKSSEDLLKCLQKFSQISNLREGGTREERGFKNLLDLNNQDQHHQYHPQQHQERDQLVPSSPTTKTCLAGDLNHGICFCIECDPLKSIWDYPLRRSFSDSSSSSTSGTGSLSDNQASENGDTQDTEWSPKSRAEIVGVIGSKRIGNNNNRNNSTKPPLTSSEQKTADMNLYSDNILGGINLSNDLFKSCATTATNSNNLIGGSSSTTTFEECLATSSPTTSLMLLPETAETLLTRSINEISKKLIETCSNEGGVGGVAGVGGHTEPSLTLSSCNSLSSFSSSSSSTSSSSANSSCGAVDFSSDSGIESAHINAGDDLVFNFDHLHIAKATSHNHSFATKSSICGGGGVANNSSSTSSSPTAKFATAMATNFLTSAAATPLSPCGLKPKTAATSLESILLDLNNNQIPKEPKNMMEETDSQQLLKFNGLTTTSSTSSPPPFAAATQQNDQQFFNNCFELMWQQQQQHNKLANHSEQLFSVNPSSSSTSSAFADNVVGPLKTVFSTIS